MGVVFGLVWGFPGSYGNGSGWSQGWLGPRSPRGLLALRRRVLPVFVPPLARPVGPEQRPRLPPRPEFVGDHLSGTAERSNESAGGRVCARRRESRHGASEGGARERKTPSDPMPSSSVVSVKTRRGQRPLLAKLFRAALPVTVFLCRLSRRYQH
jgi:hypothetical protein